MLPIYWSAVDLYVKNLLFVAAFVCLCPANSMSVCLSVCHAAFSRPRESWFLLNCCYVWWALLSLLFWCPSWLLVVRRQLDTVTMNIMKTSTQSLCLISTPNNMHSFSYNTNYTIEQNIRNFMLLYNVMELYVLQNELLILSCKPTILSQPWQ